MSGTPAVITEDDDDGAGMRYLLIHECVAKLLICVLFSANMSMSDA